MDSYILFAAWSILLDVIYCAINVPVVHADQFYFGVSMLVICLFVKVDFYFLVYNLNVVFVDNKPILLSAIFRTASAGGERWGSRRYRKLREVYWAIVQ